MPKILDQINSPRDLRGLSLPQLDQLSQEIREFIVEAVANNAGHLGSNLGVVEITLALHRVFDSPNDVILWDTGHQSYVHKIVTGRKLDFMTLRQEGGMSGYPNRKESPHDWIENSHASTALSYAHGMAQASLIRGERKNHVVVLGDGALTGGMSFEALNNIGCSATRCVIVLNDNGRSYAPTVSKLSQSVAKLRMNSKYLTAKQHIEERLRSVPGVGELAISGVKVVKQAVREYVEPPAFFEALGIRYLGPFDGHDMPTLEDALRSAAEWDGPVVVHALTRKGLGYFPAEDDDEKHLHDAPTFDLTTGPAKWEPAGYTHAFAEAIVRAGAQDPRIVAITAAMPGPTGLLPFQEAFPTRFIDVGIAEQHAATMAAGLAMGGMRPVFAVYSTFFNRCFDQATYDVALHKLPVIFVLDRAGITGEDGASHHGVLDLALALSVPEFTIFAPSCNRDVDDMLRTALSLPGPSIIRFPKGAARVAHIDSLGTGMQAVRLRRGHDVCILAVGKMVDASEKAAELLADEGINVTVWDVRVVRPLDPAMLNDALTHPVVVTVEDGVRVGGAGSAMVDALSQLATNIQTMPATIVLGVPSEFIGHAKAAAIHARLGLDAAGIATSIRTAVAARLS